MDLFTNNLLDFIDNVSWMCIYNNKLYDPTKVEMFCIDRGLVQTTPVCMYSHEKKYVSEIYGFTYQYPTNTYGL